MESFRSITILPNEKWHKQIIDEHNCNYRSVYDRQENNKE